MPAFKNRPRAAEKSKECAHCQKPSNRIRRGLCERCYKNHDLRKKYVNLSCYREPTQEEVDEMVAWGFAHLPPWWEKSFKAMEMGREE